MKTLFVSVAIARPRQPALPNARAIGFPSNQELHHAGTTMVGTVRLLCRFPTPHFIWMGSITLFAWIAFSKGA